MNVVFWVIFIGLCIKAGVILFSFFVSLFVNADGAKNLYLGLDLSKLYAYGIRHYTAVVSLLLFLAMLKAYIAYIVVMLFLKLDVSKPFTADVSSLISRISHVALGTGVLAILADGYTKWLLKKGFAVPVDWESSEFLFLAGIIFIIAQIFKRGMELQTENDLTV
jgi:hypothetical protein